MNQGVIAHSSGGGSIVVKDDGTILTSSATSINFAGAGVTASNSGNDVTATITGGGGGGASYLEVANFAALPAASGAAGEIYAVLAGQGVYFVNRKPAGFYRSDGTDWTYLADLGDPYFADNVLVISDEIDTTKKARFQLSGITTGNTRTLTVPDASGTITINDATQTLTNKTLTAPAISSPTGIVKGDVGLGSVDNTADTAKPVSTAQQTALDLKANLASPTFTGTVAGISKSMVGLGNVDNTTDAGKPVSTATQTALDLKAPLASPTFTGTVGGVTAAMVGLGNVDNTSNATERAAVATLTNKTISGAGNTLTNLPASGISGVIPIANLATGTPDGTKFVRDDGTLAVPAGGGSVSITGTPVSGQIAEWTSATAIQGKAVNGSGNVVLTTSPALVTPALGTPSSGTLTNCTGLVATTGLTATGTKDSTTFLRGDNTWAVPAGGGGGSGDMLAANNLSDVANVVTARANLGVYFGPRALSTYNAGTGASAKADGVSTYIPSACVLLTTGGGPTRCHAWWNTATVANAGTEEGAIRRGQFTRATVRFIFAQSHVSDGTDTFINEIGISRITNTSLTPVDGVFLRISGSAVYAVQRSADSETATVGSMTVSEATIYECLIDYTPATGCSIYIDGALLASVTTNEPGSTIPMHIFARHHRTAGTATNRWIEIGDMRVGLYY